MRDVIAEWGQQFGQWATLDSFTLINMGLLIAAGWVVAGMCSRRIRRLGKRFGRIDAPYRPFVADLVRYGILSLVLITALAMLGIPTAGMIALLMAFGLTAGLALQGPLRNIAAGAMMQAARPLKVGDRISAEDVTGTVTEVGLLTTSLRGDDGVFISIPNRRLGDRVIRNYSRLPSRRVDLSFSVSYDQDIEEILALCRDLVNTNGQVLREPPPEVVLSSLGETTAVITLRVWTAYSTQADLMFHLNRELKKTLDAAGIMLGSASPARPPIAVVETPTYIASPFRGRARP